jgi:hypothetical protein
MSFKSFVKPKLNKKSPQGCYPVGLRCVNRLSG